MHLFRKGEGWTAGRPTDQQTDQQINWSTN